MCGSPKAMNGSLDALYAMKYVLNLMNPYLSKLKCPVTD